MWIKSWNDKYDGTDFSYAFLENDLGYSLGTSKGTLLSLWNYNGYKQAMENLNNAKEYGNMYFPKKTPGYWIAAPSYSNADHVFYIDASSGYLQGKAYYMEINPAGLRPVVCLDANVVGNLVGDIWELE